MLVKRKSVGESREPVIGLQSQKEIGALTGPDPVPSFRTRPAPSVRGHIWFFARKKPMQRTTQSTTLDLALRMPMGMLMEAMAMPWPGRGAFVTGERS
jgi:hypothetical protein